MFPYLLHPPCLTGRALYVKTNTAEDWDRPLQFLNTAVVTMSWSSLQEADEQQKDLLQVRQGNPQQDFGVEESLEISESRLCEGVVFPKILNLFCLLKVCVCRKFLWFLHLFAQESKKTQLKTPEGHSEKVF